MAPGKEKGRGDLFSPNSQFTPMFFPSLCKDDGVQVQSMDAFLLSQLNAC